MLKLLYQGDTALTSATSSANFAIWSANSDAMFYFGNSPKNESRRVYRDGSNIHISQVGTNGNTFLFDQAPEVDSGVVVYDTIRGLSYELHPKTWTPNLQKPFTSNIDLTFLNEGLYLRNQSGVVKYYEQFARGYRVRNITTDTIEDTVEVFASAPNITLPMAWVNNQTVAFFRLTGEVSLWDLNSKTTLLNSFIEAPHTAAIDHTYQTVVSVRNSDKTTQVYALEIEPDSFSALSATPGNYERYHGETLSITVLGADGELIPNVEVHWSLQVGAKGMITPAVSLTNAVGVATASYCPPGLDWMTGDEETITAKVYI